MSVRCQIKNSTGQLRTSCDAIVDATNPSENEDDAGEQSLSEEETSDEESDDEGEEDGAVIASTAKPHVSSPKFAITKTPNCGLMDDDDDVGYSQDPRSFFERFVWNETDVRFFNNTNKEVLFIIADEEFTLQRTTKVSASASTNDDDDGGGLIGNAFGLVPISASARASHSTTVCQTALKTRCMPLAPRSHSSQHFHEERLTYVTALTKDADGEGMPWTRVHYENKVINCKRTKSLKFFNKHLRVTAYRIVQQMGAPMIPTEMATMGERKRLTLTHHGSKKRIKDGS